MGRRETQSQSVCGGGGEGGSWGGQLQLVKRGQEGLPAGRVLFGFERKREVRIEVEDIVAEVRRGYVKFTLRELQEERQRL